MSAEHSGEAAHPTPYAPPKSKLTSVHPDGRLTLFALFESVIGSALLILALGMLVLTAAFLVWALMQGNIPLFGMFMATALRAVIALVLGVPGLLLLWAARTCRAAATKNDLTAHKAMSTAHGLLLISILAIFFLLLGAIFLFFVALSFSNM